MDMQSFVNAISAAGQMQRSNYHLTLGCLIDKLEAAPTDALVMVDVGGGVDEFRSYRGYYSDLAIEPSETPSTAAALLESAKEALGKTFNGYKGGDYTMDYRTPLWVAEYGYCGRAVIGCEMRDNSLILLTKADE